MKAGRWPGAAVEAAAERVCNSIWMLGRVKGGRGGRQHVREPGGRRGTTSRNVQGDDIVQDAVCQSK